MTEKERLADKKQTTRALILICVGFVIFIFYNIKTHTNEDTSNTDNVVDSTISTDNTTTTDESSYENATQSETPQIVACPKCGKSYNKNTWGEMCNTCWSNGKGLKSNGRYVNP